METGRERGYAVGEMIQVPVRGQRWVVILENAHHQLLFDLMHEGFITRILKFGQGVDEPRRDLVEFNFPFSVDMGLWMARLADDPRKSSFTAHRVDTVLERVN